MRQFNWQAFLKDGSILRQFSPTGVELSFKAIQEEEKKGNIEGFYLIHEPTDPIKKTLKLGVSLVTGSFLSNFLFEKEKHHPKENLKLMVTYRLIYYRRMRADQTPDSKGLENYIHRYLLGWQVTHEGWNYQRIIFLNPNTLEFDIKEKR